MAYSGRGFGRHKEDRKVGRWACFDQHGSPIRIFAARTKVWNIPIGISVVKVYGMERAELSLCSSLRARDRKKRASTSRELMSRPQEYSRSLRRGRADGPHVPGQGPAVEIAPGDLDFLTPGDDGGPVTRISDEQPLMSAA
jgi:hypothetical protein